MDIFTWSVYLFCGNNKKNVGLNIIKYNNAMGSVVFLRIRDLFICFVFLNFETLGNAEVLLGDIPHFPTLPEWLHFLSCKEQRVQKVGVRMSGHGGKTRKWLQAENGGITGTTIKGHVQAFPSASPHSFSSNIKYKQRCLKQNNTITTGSCTIMEPWSWREC